ncbi:hypothetical protein ACIBEJ_32040 [Nonomuraea sp. NPDC050790]|uniref:hypothetical protein n=1 Tax=Nonomuraea sp. NPDC050790 TaxID=3364371 RepID=UPI0037878CF7
MNKIRYSLAAVVLAGATASMTGTASADPWPFPTCSEIQTSTGDGYVYAFPNQNCQGNRLGRSQGNDSDWGQPGGGFTDSATDRARSVVNNGQVDPNGYNVVALYDYTAYSWQWGYRCLDRGDWVTDLVGHTYTPNPNGTRTKMAYTISSHQWVKKSACAAGSMIG